jgi:hypothetical protein
MRIPVTRLCLALVCLLASVAAAQQKSAPAPIVITHVTLISPGTSSVQPDRTVVVIGDRIASVSDSLKAQWQKGAHVIDATGQFLIPGLWDMHVHSAFGDWFPRGREIILPLFIANGVTGVRDMGGDVPVLLEWRKEIASRKIIGPRMVISGPMLDAYLPNGKLRFPSSVAVTTPADAVAAVDSLKVAARRLHQSPIRDFARRVFCSGRRSPQAKVAHRWTCSG